MEREYLRCVEVAPTAEAKCSVIWLHGLGADGHDFEPIVPHLGLDPALGVRFVFPHAPRIPVTINMGLIMPAWYDVRGLDLDSRVDERGVRRSAAQVSELIERENRSGIPTRRIVLAGFSQGGAIALHVALRHPERLAGVLALSTYLVCEDSLEAERSEANRGLAMFQAHGLHDPMVPCELGRAAHERLVALGYQATWHVYPLQHEVSLDEVRDVGRWLTERLSADVAGD